MITTRRKGSTLVLVLVIGLLLAFLAFATAQIANTGRTAEGFARRQETTTYQCEAVAELLRLELCASWEASGFTPALWMTGIRQAGPTAQAPLATATVVGCPGSPRRFATYAAFPGIRAWVDRVGPDGQNWVDIVASTDGVDPSRSASVRIRLGWGTNPIFDLAMLTVTTDCMFCHMRIRGDIGSIGYFKPGWGSGTTSGTGGESGRGSSVDGDIYTAAATVAPAGAGGTFAHPTDGTVASIRGLTYTDDLQTSYTGSRLPKDIMGGPDGDGDGQTDPDGTPDFPSINPTEALLGAKGKVWAGDPGNGGDPAAGNGGVWITPLDGDWSSRVSPNKNDFQSGGGPAAPIVNATGSVINGNLVLIGTDTHPIEIDGDIYVTGDVMIKGPVVGKGAIYSGRNTYVVGDIYFPTANQPGRTEGAGGDGLGVGGEKWPFPANATGDADAVASLVADQADPTPASEFRLAARENVVIGDWTYRSDAGTVDQMRQRQGQDFMTAQFNLNPGNGTQKFFHNSSEVKKVIEGGVTKYVNDQGFYVPASEVAAVTRASANEVGTISRFDAKYYDSVLAPGQVVRDGSGNGQFDPWITQDEFGQVLGTKQYSDMPWRMNASGASAAELAAELGPLPTGSGWPAGRTSWSQVANGQAWYDANQLGAANGELVRRDGAAYRVVDTGVVTRPTQVNRIDAFLYANKRIAGSAFNVKSSAAGVPDASTASVPALTINGGMAASEIGVLAPGVREGSSWWKRRSSIEAASTDKGSFPATPWFSNARYDDGIALNYDFRLRNGGYGFNLVEGEQGDATLYERGVGRAP